MSVTMINSKCLFLFQFLKVSFIYGAVNGEIHGSHIIHFFYFLYQQGTISLISTEGIHQLHIFIFFLAVFHVVYSAVTMALGRLKVCCTIFGGVNAQYVI